MVIVEYMLGVGYGFLMESKKTFADVPLRAQKRARTRQALIDAFITRLGEHPIEAIAVSDLCVEAQISQATFFNYFPNKSALLTHFIQLWSLRVGVLAAAVMAENDSALRSIEALFAATAADTAPYPNVMLELIAHQARMPADLVPEPIEEAERLLFLPDVDDVNALSDEGLAGILPALVSDAIVRGELPPNTDVSAITLSLISTFFGVPLILGRKQPQLLAPVYQQQLQLIWAAARGIS